MLLSSLPNSTLKDFSELIRLRNIGLDQACPTYSTARVHFFAQFDILICTLRLLHKQTRSKSKPP